MPATKKSTCPKCGAERVEKRNTGTKVGATFGLAAGALASSNQHKMIGEAISKAAARLAGATASSTFSAGALRTTGEVGLAILAFSAVGVAVGAACGNGVDKHILNNFQCYGCDHSFSTQ